MFHMLTLWIPITQLAISFSPLIYSPVEYLAIMYYDFEWFLWGQSHIPTILLFKKVFITPFEKKKLHSEVEKAI